MAYLAMTDDDLQSDGEPPVSDNVRDIEMHVAGRVGHGAILRGNRLIMWGGYTRSARVKEGFLVINLETGKKKKLEPILSDEDSVQYDLRGNDRHRIATCYSASAYTVDGNYLYTFGGHSLSTNSAVNFFFRFKFQQRSNSSHRSWIDEARDNEKEEYIEWHILDACVETHANRPSPRDKHCMFVYDNKIFSFGGFGPSMYLGYLKDHGDWKPNMDENDDRGWNNQFLIYDLEEGYWRNPPTSGNVPCPRAAHSMCVVGSKAYLFGGRSEPRRLNDLYYLELRNLQWTAISPTGEMPCPRSWGSLTKLDDNHLFVFGGMDNDKHVVGDGYVLDISEGLMRRVITSEDSTHRLWHSTLLSDDHRVIVVGGCSTSIYSSSPVYPGTFLQFRVHKPSSLYAVCLRYCAKHISEFHTEQLLTLNHFIGLDIVNHNRLRHMTPCPWSAAGV